MVMVVVSLLLCVTLTVAQSLVNIPGLGSIQGRTSQSYFTKRPIYQFTGVPYAERPVRFMQPVKKAPWEGVLKATSPGRSCPQTGSQNIGDVEDCLFLDVYTPSASNSSSMAVLFFIHGGAFVGGSSQIVGPGFLLEHDMVVVAPQYRLGPLGFLSLGVDEIMGNAAMYDQLMALQWTYDNIHNFGGDPKKITVAGVSAGAASAALQYVSPLTQDLIHQVILLSGSAVAFWAVGQQPISHSLSVAEFAGCTGDISDIVSCLQNMDALALIDAYTQYEANETRHAHSGRDATNPVVDGLFLDRMPLDILNDPSFKGRPMIMSVVKHEGKLFEEILYNSFLQGNNLTNDYNTLKYDIPDVLLSYCDMKDVAWNIGDTISKEYFKPEQFGNYSAMQPGIVDFMGSSYFKGPARKMAELNNARGGPSYLTTYDYYSEGMHTNGIVLHGTDQTVFFPFNGYRYSEVDLGVVRTVTAMYANFISTGTPSGVSWEPYTLENGNYLVVNTTLSQRSPFEQEYTVAVREGLYH